VREEEIIRQLPNSMVANVHKFLFGDLTRESTLLTGSQTGQEGMIKSVLERLERIMVPKSEFIIKEGELADEMFFIIRGEVEIINAEEVIIATLTQNMHFGEMALIEDGKTKVRSTSALAKTNVSLAVLSNANFRLIFSHYPEFKAKLEEIIQKRANNL
jgi:voltage-gated potassium channel